MSNIAHVVPALAASLSARGYEVLTPVQDAVLDPGLQGRDLIVSAQTGSGKTVAFGLALAPGLMAGAEAFARADAPLALVIAPTRELALQVSRELDWLYAPAKARIVSCVGGMDARDERRALQGGAHIVVGTPGRLVDHIRRGALVMDSLKAVVLDEADEMLNLGFREELEHILEASPEDRRTLMFSATMPRAIEALAGKYQRDAVRVNTVNAREQHLDIAYQALVAPGHETDNAIYNVLRFHDAKNAIVFCATRAAVARMTSRFSNRGFSVVAISGELSQAERSHALQALRDHRAQVCIATDVAARGIDLPDLELVIHADLPKNREGLLHRSGRTGRAGRKGTSVLIVPHKSRKRVERLFQDAGIEANWGEPPSADEISRMDEQRLLDDPVLSQAPDGTEARLAGALIEKYGAEAVAAAFVRMQRKGKAAPEDLSPVPAFEPVRDRDRAERKPRKAARDDFSGGVWISLSVGRAKSAEPRWLLPMICKAGGLGREDVGAIRIEEHESHVEIAPGSVGAFFEALGPGGKLEGGISARRLDGAPPAPGPQKRAFRPDRPGGDRPPYKGKPDKRADDAKPAERDPKAFKGQPKKGFKPKASKTAPQNRNKRKWSPDKA